MNRSIINIHSNVPTGNVNRTRNLLHSNKCRMFASYQLTESLKIQKNKKVMLSPSYLTATCRIFLVPAVYCWRHIPEISRISEISYRMH